MWRSLWVGALAWLVSIFLYSPRLALFLLPSSGATRRDDLLAQCVDPFTRTLDEPLLFYRILQPLIAHSLGWCGSRTEFLALLGSPGIAYLALILSLSCVYWALVRRVSASLSLLTTFALATTQVTQWTNLYWGHPDSLSLLPAALLMCSRRTWIVFATTFLGVLNDERFILALPFIVLWWWIDDLSSWQNFRLWLPQALAFLAAMVVYSVLRLSLFYGWIGPGIDYQWGSTFSQYAIRLISPGSWPGLLVMVLMSFRWLWIIPTLWLIRSTRSLFAMKDWIYFLSLFTVIAASFAFSADVSRNIAFAFPFLPVAVLWLSRDHGFGDSTLRRVLAVSLGLNIITPAATFFDTPDSINPLKWGSLYLPLPANVWRWLSLRGSL